MSQPHSKLQRITYIFPSTFARVSALLTCIMTVVWMVPVTIRLIIVDIANGQLPLDGLYRLAMIVVVCALGYATGLLLAIGYNILAKYSGGIEIELSDV
ncbi:MAG: hypothetical protein O3A01_01725 [bacterium]|nr:hypothetical protein [bacterium]